MSRPAALVGLAVGALCGLLAAPGLTWLDAGELGAAAAELGVAHPPGFPIFAAVTHGVMRLVPVGDAAFRGNLASALWAAAAAAAIFGAARAFGARRAAAAAGAGLFALSPWLLLHGTTIEVYTGAAAMTAAGLWAVGALGRGGDLRPALALGFGVGLAAGHHAELRLFAGLVMLAGLARIRGHRRAVWPIVIAAVIGGLVVLYLPLRAGADPWRNWGDPSTLGGLWHHLNGSRIREAFADRFGRLDLGAMALYARQLLGGAPLAVLLGFVGFAAVARRPGGWLLPAAWLVDALYATTLNPMGLPDAQNGLPGLAALAIGAGLGVERLLTAGRLSAARPGVHRLVAAGAVLAAGLWTIPRAELYVADRGLTRVIERVVDTQPPEALVLVASDNLAAGLAWRQVVEGSRPDLAVVVRQHVRYASSVEPVARRLPHALAGWRPGAGLGALRRLGEPGWPVGWEGAEGLDRAARPAGLRPRFPLLARPAEADEPVTPPPELAAGLGPQGRRALANWLSDRGRFELAAGRVPLAGAAFEEALTLEPASGLRWDNLATALAAAGRHPEARQAAERAVALAPSDRNARLNFARYAMHAGDAAAARAELDRLIGELPTAPALALRGVIRGNGGDLAGARADFDAALALDPNQPEARAGVETLRRMRGEER